MDDSSNFNKWTKGSFGLSDDKICIDFHFLCFHVSACNFEFFHFLHHLDLNAACILGQKASQRNLFCGILLFLGDFDCIGHSQ